MGLMQGSGVVRLMPWTPAVASAAAPPIVGWPMLWLGWFALAAADDMRVVPLAVLAFLAVHVALGWWLPRPGWAVATAAVAGFAFLLQLFQQDILAPRSAWAETGGGPGAVVGVAMAALALGCVAAGGIALGAGLRRRRAAASAAPRIQAPSP